MENCYADEQTQKTLRVYSGRAIGSHRHYRDSCRIAAASSPSGTRGRSTYAMFEQSEANGIGILEF